MTKYPQTATCPVCKGDRIVTENQYPDEIIGPVEVEVTCDECDGDGEILITRLLELADGEIYTNQITSAIDRASFEAALLAGEIGYDATAERYLHPNAVPGEGDSYTMPQPAGREP
jgi:RecJ-like exonuclease